MSLVNLTTETMVVQSERLLDPKKVKKTLTSLPLIQMLVPVLQKAHDDLHSKQRKVPAAAKELKKLREEELTRDGRHDRKLRGTYSYLTGLSDLTDDPEIAAEVLDLRDRLVPKGLSATTRSYVDEAGDAKMLPSRLDAASKKLLGKLQTPDGALQVHVDAWVEEAQQLGVLEERREQLEKDLKGGGGGPTAAEVVAARHAWIRAVRAIETNLALVPDITDETIDTILGPLRRAEMKADRRKGATKGKSTGALETTEDDEAPPPEPSDTEENAAEEVDAAADTEKPITKPEKPITKPEKPATKPAKPA